MRRACSKAASSPPSLLAKRRRGLHAREASAATDSEVIWCDERNRGKEWSCGRSPHDPLGSRLRAEGSSLISPKRRSQMKAITVEPKPESARLEEVQEPDTRNGSVLLFNVIVAAGLGSRNRSSYSSLMSRSGTLIGAVLKHVKSMKQHVNRQKGALKLLARVSSLSRIVPQSGFDCGIRAECEIRAYNSKRRA